MKSFLLILFVCMVLIPYKVYSQENADNKSIIAYAASMHDKGYQELSTGNFKKAIEYTQKAVNLRKEISGVNNIDYLKSLHNLAICYAGIGNYNEAVYIGTEVQLLTKDKLDLKELHAMTTSLLGRYYYGAGNNEKAIEVGIDARNLCKEIFGEKHNEYAASLSSLAYSYIAIGNLDEAEELELEASEIFKQNNNIYGFVSSIKNIGIICINKNDYETAKKLLESVAKWYKQLGQMIEYYSALSTLTICYNYLGEYSKGIIIGEEALLGYKNLCGENSHQYATTLGNLSLGYLMLGNSEKYIEYTNKALSIQEQIFGTNHHIYALSLANTAYMYGTHINVNKAIELNQKALDIYKSNSMTETSYYKTAISNQIQFNISLGKYKETINDIFSVLPKTNKDSGIYGDYLHKLSVCYNFIGDYDKSIQYGNESLSSFKERLGKSHLSYIMGLEFQNKNYLSDLRKYENLFINNLKEEAECITLFTQNNVLTYSDKERHMWWTEINQFYEDLANYLFIVKEKTEIKKILYNGLLTSKGILLNIDKEIRNIINKTPNDTIQNKYKLLQTYRKQINKHLSMGSNININDLHENISLTERELLINIKEKFILDNYSITMDSIQSYMNTNDIAIEFINFPYFEFETDSMVYGAMVIKKNWSEPVFFAFKTEKLIKKHYYNTSQEKNIEALYYWIWNSFIQKGFIKPGDNIYFSASGILHQIPIESLPIGDGKIMSDVYNMHRLSSTRELVKEKKEMKYTKAALYGGLNYDMTDNELLSESQTYYKDASEEYFVSRGLLEDSIRGYKWDNLNNTLQEVNYISELMNKNQVTTQTYRGNKGYEESFKALSGHEYNIIHLATHGFFYPDEEAKEKDYFKPMMLNDHYRTFDEVDMSMWRSGLVMSGGNRAWKGDTIPDNVEDGILKAQEIGDLDLRGADLVVLSACNTGQGEVTGEGVFGLQRAFKMAGAQTIVMSLTPVDDQTTMAMMNKFYTNLFSGQSKHDAFYNAQRYIRSIKPDPKYWMGWIMLD